MLERESQVEILYEYMLQAQDTSHLADAYIHEHEVPRKTTIKIASDSINKRDAAFEAEALSVADQEFRFRSAGDQPRSQRIEAWITMSKNIEGERLLVVHGVVVKTTKVSGGYEFLANVQSVRRHILPAHRIFAECVAKGDAISWNRWYAPLNQSVDLKRLNLSGTNLAQFDLCAANLFRCDLRNANLSGANLSGANLDECVLDGAVVEGADFFGAALPARYEPLLKASGLLERESVTLIA